MTAPLLKPSVSALAEMELFQGLSSAALSEAEACARVARIKRNTIVFAQGDPATACYALLEGRIRITQSDDGGAELLVRFIGAGEMFGTVALFTDRRYPAEAVAVLDSVEIHWPEEALLKLIERYPQIALNLVRVIGRRLREVQERLREVASQRVERRIAHALLRFTAPTVPSKDPGAALNFPLTRKDVADMCGATLHTASRVLTAWERAGLITSQRQRVTIRDLRALQRIADDFSRP